MDAPIEDPPHLRTLRKLVTVMTVVFILGFITIVIVIVMQFTRTQNVVTGPKLPELITIPSDEFARAVTFGDGWVALVTVDTEGAERIRTYTPEGNPLQTMDIEINK